MGLLFNMRGIVLCQNNISSLYCLSIKSPSRLYSKTFLDFKALENNVKNLSCSAAGTEAVELTGSIRLAASQNSWSSTSDMSLKQVSRVFHRECSGRRNPPALDVCGRLCRFSPGRSLNENNTYIITLLDIKKYMLATYKCQIPFRYNNIY